MAEIEVIKAIKIGDRKAFKYIFEQYYNRLVAYITTYTHNKILSEDIVQQTFVVLWEDREKININKSFQGYIYKIAYHRYIDSIKKEKRRSRKLNELWEHALSNRIIEDKEVTEKRIIKLTSIIERLPPKSKEVIMLNKVHGVKYKDIAIKMGISIKTVESHMRSAFKKIRKEFEKDTTIFMLIRKFFSPI
ncbi:RNA polymerase sigma factor [Flavivirga sp. 57AJ16]|uniref:RNA polymerase sigma factor n=1 Tax=Flavivirga sp. 57AJ16 TaxID=3025307 RepID=UPI002366E526|nr:RNA polymerase sigma-70 factor [Flavivirga sp. 57AJ16]MDD7885491.1 RNA polymerase sigma-70 factor [Flavivirga sp. 57AJ16]